MNYGRWKRPKPLFPQQTQLSEQPKRPWAVLPFLGKTIARICMMIGAFVLVSFFLLIWGLSSAIDKKEAPAKLPDDMIVSIDFKDGLKEVPGSASLSDPFGYGPPTVKEFIDALSRAKSDKRVRGIVAKLDSGTFELGQVQELRAAIKDFRSSGKFAYLYSSSLGEMSGGLGRYLLASSFGQIWMQPLGVVSIPGINAQMPFGRALLDKWGVTPEFYQRKEFKSAYENLTNEHMSDSNRAAMTELVNDLKDQIVGDLAADLKRAPQSVQALVDKGLFTAQEALNAKLITKIGYEDELHDKIMTDLTGDAKSDTIKMVDIADYAHSAPLNTSNGKKPKVALIYTVGEIVPSREDGASPLAAGAGKAAADEIAGALLDAAADKDVEAVVMRIDSPGGSPVASEDILRAVEKTQQEGKPVVVSMGPTAASGGYWIASYADQIFVMPGTLTGSIGVVGGKFALADMWSKLGVNWEGVNWGHNAAIWSFNGKFSDSEAERINAMLDQVYDAFIARVAKGREMSPEDVEKVAKGHVWSGKKAVALGLADQIGGLNEALDYTATLLSQKDRSALDVEIMPKPKTPVEKLLAMVNGEQSAVRGANSLKIISDFAAPVAAQLQMLQRPGQYGVYEPMQVR